MKITILVTILVFNGMCRFSAHVINVDTASKGGVSTIAVTSNGNLDTEWLGASVRV